MKRRTVLLAAAMTGLPCLVHAQFDFKIYGRDVQVHSFVSQGFAYSNDNNYLTMKTSEGSFAMTDGGVNISSQLTDKFRVSAQVYGRNLGNLSNWHPSLDFAVADYRLKDWFGVRGGRVKTTLGLFNNTQDMEFLHTFAILPQSMYPLDLRASTIAHTGGDLYGTISLKKLGELSYTAYAGKQVFDKYGGYYYGIENSTVRLSTLTGLQEGGDLRWNGLIKGVLFGASYLHVPVDAAGAVNIAPGMSLPLDITGEQNTSTFYAEYKIGNLTLDAEYRRLIAVTNSAVGPLPASRTVTDSRGWYAAAAYRVSKRLELGAYHSRYVPSWAEDSAPVTNHMNDTVAAAKIDLSRHWDFKVEGHFMDGYGSWMAFRGFYPQDNPTGLKPKTNMLVLRTGWNF